MPYYHFQVYGEMVPAFRGLGFSVMWTRLYVNIYTPATIAWTLFFSVHSVLNRESGLPWGLCGQDWNSNKCMPQILSEDCLKLE